MTYYLTFKAQYCVDDGGVGHDVFWRESTVALAAKNDKEAKIQAKKYLIPGTPCNGSFCDNQRLKKKIRLYSVETITRDID